VRERVPQDLAVFLDADCGAGTTTISGVTTAPVGSAVEISDTNHFTLTATTIAPTQSGMYLVIASMTTDATSTTRTATRCWMQVDTTGTGSSYATLAQTVRWMYCRTTATGEDSATMHVIMHLPAGSLLRMQTSIVAGSTAQIKDDACSWTLVRLAAS